MVIHHHPYSAPRHLDAMGTRPGALGVPTMHPTSLRVCHWGARRRAQPRKVCGYIVSRQLYQGKTMLIAMGSNTKTAAIGFS